MITTINTQQNRNVIIDAMYHLKMVLVSNGKVNFIAVNLVGWMNKTIVEYMIGPISCKIDIVFPFC